MFEGSYRKALTPSAQLECKICGWVYHPERGDPVWQIPPGTAFSALPEHWCCPECDNPTSQFLLLQQ